MTNRNNSEVEPIHKYFRGKWKNLTVKENADDKINIKEYEVKDLENKTIIELEELIQREEKILKNE